MSQLQLNKSEESDNAPECDDVQVLVTNPQRPEEKIQELQRGLAQIEREAA